MPCPLPSFVTLDETSFLKDLAERNPTAFAAYSRIVLAGMRRYDPGVNIDVVRMVVLELGGVA